MRCEVNLKSLSREFLSKRQREIVVFAFLGLENCTWRLTPLLFPFLGKAESKKPCCQMRRRAVKAGEARREGGGGGGGRLGAELYAISALVSFACIIHPPPTNYLGLAPSKRRNAVDLSEGVFSHLHHHAAQSRPRPADVSSPFSDTLKWRLLIFSPLDTTQDGCGRFHL